MYYYTGGEYFWIFSENIPIKYKNYITYIGLNVGFSSIYFLHKKIVLWGRINIV